MHWNHFFDQNSDAEYFLLTKITIRGGYAGLPSKISHLHERMFRRDTCSNGGQGDKGTASGFLCGAPVIEHRSFFLNVGDSTMCNR